MANKDKDPRNELDDLKQLIGGEEWFAALKVAKEHRDFLQGEVNRFVKEQNLIEAFAALARMNDADKIFRLIQARFKTVAKGE